MRHVYVYLYEYINTQTYMKSIFYFLYLCTSYFNIYTFYIIKNGYIHTWVCGKIYLVNTYSILHKQTFILKSINRDSLIRQLYNFVHCPRETEYCTYLTNDKSYFSEVNIQYHWFLILSVNCFSINDWLNPVVKLLYNYIIVLNGNVKPKAHIPCGQS